MRITSNQQKSECFQNAFLKAYLRISITASYKRGERQKRKRKEASRILSRKKKPNTENPSERNQTVKVGLSTLSRSTVQRTPLPTSSQAKRRKSSEEGVGSSLKRKKERSRKWLKYLFHHQLSAL